ncbi:hypothetical protein BGX21_011348 [Mortierella sp. AD011]|nr:hypothetical protein BGX20_010298 [Mortierella sp. AD010]KAF9390937.1 hypothetical protein BGX21_011348 [Mortierella sp. AD011]
MFKKRAPAKKKSDEDEDAITVSVPLDTDIVSQTTTTTTTTITSTTTSHSSDGESARNGNENRHVQPHQPWKPWDSQKRSMNGRRTSQSSKISAIAATQPTSAPSAKTTLTSPTADTKSPSMMLNLSSMFSSTPSTPQQPQPVEAQLWNADITLASPISPAVPRYIPAIAGNGARSRTPGSNASGSNGRLASGWAVVAASTNRRSNDGNTGWRSFGQATPISPSSPGIGTAGSGTRTRSPSTSSTTSSILSTPSMSPPTNHHTGGIEKPHLKSSMSFRSASVSTTTSTSSIIPTMSNESLNSRFLNGVRGKGVTSRGVAEDAEIAQEMYLNEKATHKSSSTYTNGSDYEDYDDDLRDRKKDRSRPRGHYRRGGNHSHYLEILRNPKRVLRSQLFCLRQNRRLHPAVRLVVIIFLAGSVLYTTFHLIFRESRSKDKIRRSFDYTEQQLNVRRMLGRSGSTVRKKPVSSFDVEAQKYSIHQWALDTYDVNNSKAIVRTSEDYMLSKAFAGAMQPTRIIPFYFKASFMDENDDDDLHEDDDDGLQGFNRNGANEHSAPVLLDPSMVTITTMITPDRYSVFLKLVKQYRGPISVATHIRKGPDQDKMFHELNAFFAEHAILRKYVDLHVIVDGVDFQLNMWRNVGRMFARTDYFMMLDVDFHIPSSLKNNLHHDPRSQELLSSGAALVVPAFEYSLEHDPKDSKYFPDTKAELIPLLEKKHIRVFHDSFPPGHAATDTPRWVAMSKRSDSGRIVPPPKGRAGFEEEYGQYQDSSGGDDGAVVEGVGSITEEEQEEYLEKEADGARPYKVTAFEPKYEPYIILKREGTPWCDERFVGYGANKAACLFEIYISGVDFWVMPHDFLIHQYHDYPTTNRKNGRILNKQLFIQFQQEICFSTLRRMIVTGEWYTSKADNLRHQCGPFENFLKSADEMAQEFEDQHPNSLLEDPVFVADVDPTLKRKHQLKHSVEDRYEGRGGKAALGDQIVDDEEHQDPFMSRPKGKIWGGIQPRKYYTPPPPVPGVDIPIDGIDVDDAITGDLDKDASHNPGEEKENKENNLMGEELEQFRQGVIMQDQFAFEKHNEHQVIGDEDETKADEQTKDELPSHRQDDQKENAVDSSYEKEQKSLPRHQDNLHGEHTSFEDEAGRLEEMYRVLGAGAA